MLLLFETGVTASFMVYQTAKIWQPATLHNFLWSGRNFLQDLSYLEEVTSPQSQLPAGHRCWTVTCGGGVAFRSSWKLIHPNEIIPLPATEGCVWAETRWDHSSPAPNLQRRNTSSRRLCHSRSSWGSLGWCLPEQPLLSPAAQSAAAMVFKL